VASELNQSRTSLGRAVLKDLRVSDRIQENLIVPRNISLYCVPSGARSSGGVQFTTTACRGTNRSCATNGQAEYRNAFAKSIAASMRKPVDG
jgi:hypothetical protein